MPRVPFVIKVEPYNEREIELGYKTYRFPDEFIRSKSTEKYVHVLKFTVINTFTTNPNTGQPLATKQYMRPIYIALESTFNQDSGISNSRYFICFSNEDLPKPKSYKQHTTTDTFRIKLWDLIENECLVIRDNGDGTTPVIMIEMELEY